MVGGAPVVVLGLAKVRAVVRLAETGDLKGGTGNLRPLGEGFVDLGPLNVPGPDEETETDRETDRERERETGSTVQFLLLHVMTSKLPQNISSLVKVHVF